MRLPSIIGICLSGGFLLAFFMRAGYGGSMDYWHGPEPNLLGVDVAVLGVGVIFLSFVSALAARTGNAG